MTSPGTQQNPGLLPDRTCLMPAALCAQSITSSRPSPRIEGVREGTQTTGNAHGVRVVAEHLGLDEEEHLHKSHAELPVSAAAPRPTPSATSGQSMRPPKVRRCQIHDTRGRARRAAQLDRRFLWFISCPVHRLGVRLAPPRTPPPPTLAPAAAGDSQSPRLVRRPLLPRIASRPWCPRAALRHKGIPSRLMVASLRK